MKKVWQIILLALFGLALAVSFALLISHAVVSVLDREEARELELERGGTGGKRSRLRRNLWWLLPGRCGIVAVGKRFEGRKNMSVVISKYDLRSASPEEAGLFYARVQEMKM